MANLKASKKDIRSIAKRTARNTVVKSRLKTLAKKLVKASEDKDKDALKTVSAEYSSALDKAAKRCVIHTNRASRQKARISKLVAAAN